MWRATADQHVVGPNIRCIALSDHAHHDSSLESGLRSRGHRWPRSTPADSGVFRDLAPHAPNFELADSTAAPKPTPLFRCQACHTTFLTETGLIAHHGKFPQRGSDERSEVSGVLPSTRPEHRIPRITVKHMLACRPDGPCPFRLGCTPVPCAKNLSAGKPWLAICASLMMFTALMVFHLSHKSMCIRGT